MEDLWKTRPSAVVEAVASKFAKLSALTEGSKPVWANMGHANVKIFYSRSGAYLDLDDLLQHFVADPQGRLLDLGTAEGSLLLHAHNRYNVPWRNLLGISAFDHRLKSTDESKNDAYIPDDSYVVANIDNLGMECERVCKGGKFRFIWSACTFYHLVDPLGTLAAVYQLLEVEGLAVIQHVPLRGSLHADVQGATAERVEEEARFLERFLQGQGFRGVVLETLDKPGFCTVALRKLRGSPEKLLLPYEYKGDMHVVGGDGDVKSSAYMWAGLRRMEVEFDKETGGLSRKEFFESLGVPPRLLEFKKPPSRDVSSKSNCCVS